MKKKEDKKAIESKPERRGLKLGRTNNPDGRLLGAKNKVQLAVKEKIVKSIGDDFDSFIKEIKSLPKKDKVKAKIELIKLVVLRP